MKQGITEKESKIANEFNKYFTSLHFWARF